MASYVTHSPLTRLTGSILSSRCSPWATYRPGAHKTCPPYWKWNTNSSVSGQDRRLRGNVSFGKNQPSKSPFWKQSNSSILEIQSIETRKQTIDSRSLQSMTETPLTAVSALRQGIKSTLKHTPISRNFSMNKLIPVSLLSNTWFLRLCCLYMSHCLYMSYYLHISTMAVELNGEGCKKKHQ